MAEVQPRVPVDASTLTMADESDDSTPPAVRTSMTGCGESSEPEAAATGGVETPSRVGGGARVTVTVVVATVSRSGAVTLTRIGLAPTDRVIGPEAVPDAIAVSSTVIVAPLAETVGVSVTDVVRYGTATA